MGPRVRARATVCGCERGREMQTQRPRDRRERPSRGWGGREGKKVLGGGERAGQARGVGAADRDALWVEGGETGILCS